MSCRENLWNTNIWSSKFRETWVQSQVVSYQRLEKLYLILPSLKLSKGKVEQSREKSSALPYISV